MHWRHYCGGFLVFCGLAGLTGGASVPAHAAEGVTKLEVPGELTYVPSSRAMLSTPDAGIVWSLEKEPGESVKKGDLLAVMSLPAVGKLKGELLEIHAELRLHQQLLARLRAAEAAIPAAQVVEEELAALKTRVRLENLRQELVNLGVPLRSDDLKDREPEELARRLHFLGLPPDLVERLDRETAPSNLVALRSPLAGQVIERTVVVGQGLETGESLYAVADPRQLALMLAVPLDQVGQLQPGLEVRFQPTGAETEISGKIDWISQAVDRESGTVAVRVNLPNPDGKLRANLLGRAWILLPEKPE